MNRPSTDSPVALPLPDCATLRARGLDPTAAGEDFYRRYPKALAGEETVERVALDEAALDNVVGYLVCAAGLAGDDPVVVDNGLALFASRRHGAAALARLDALASGSGAEAAAARRFLGQVKGNLAGPGE